MTTRQIMSHIANGEVPEFVRLLENYESNPVVDNNNPVITTRLEVGLGWTLLHEAVYHEQPEIVKILLAHPKINVNAQAHEGITPLCIACRRGNATVVDLLISDPRTDATITYYSDVFPLWMPNRFSKTHVQLLIASGKSLGDLRNMAGIRDLYSNTLWVAMNSNTSQAPEVVQLINDFYKDQAKTRHAVRMEMGRSSALSAHLFALIVLVCDGLLEVIMVANPKLMTESCSVQGQARRFFRILCELPMELQMVVCLRAFQSPRNVVLTKDSEPAFRSHALHYKELEEKEDHHPQHRVQHQTICCCS